MRSWPIVSAVFGVALALGCSDSKTNSVSGSDPLPILTVQAIGTVVSFTTAPLALTPSFSPSVQDYYVRCASGNNPLTLTVSDAKAAPTSTSLNLLDDQSVVVAGQYWIRCLPPDFPAITVSQAGTPTPGYYLVNSATFGAVFDTNGVPVWYARGSSVVNVSSPATDTISLMLNFSGAFGPSPVSNFEVRSLATGTVTTVSAVSSQTDVHELQLLPNGNFLLFAAPLENGVDLTGLQTFGPNQTMADCEIEEVDSSGNLVWSWLASEHIDPVLESTEPETTPTNGVSVIDVFHCNSIDLDAAGNLLISVRHADALFYIERSTGTVLWKLGGSSYNKDGAALISIQNDPQTAFYKQHDARWLANGDVTLFDDHGAGTGVARGVEYAIDHQANVASLVFQSLGTAASEREGSFRRYADGDSVISWGYVPTDPRVVTEIDANGNDVFDIAFDGTNTSYRGVKVPLSQLDIYLMRQTAGM